MIPRVSSSVCATVSKSRHHILIFQFEKRSKWNGVSMISRRKGAVTLTIYRKTTTMVFKILGIERTYDTGSFRGALAKPRQLFVTQSQVLAKKVDDYYAKLYQSHATAHLTPAQLKEMASKNRARRERMVDEDEEIFYTSTLPRRYGALEDSHFPLFLTYSHVS